MAKENEKEKRSPRDAARLAWRTLVLVYRSSPSMTLLLGGLTLLVAVLPLGIAYAGN